MIYGYIKNGTVDSARLLFGDLLAGEVFIRLDIMIAGIADSVKIDRVNDLLGNKHRNLKHGTL